MTGKVMKGKVLVGKVLEGKLLAGKLLVGKLLAGKLLVGNLLAGKLLVGNLLAGKFRSRTEIYLYQFLRITNSFLMSGSQTMPELKTYVTVNRLEHLSVILQ